MLYTDRLAGAGANPFEQIFQRALSHLSAETFIMVTPPLPTVFTARFVFKAHSLLYHSTLSLRVIKKKKKKGFASASPRCRTLLKGVFRGHVAYAASNEIHR